MTCHKETSAAKHRTQAFSGESTPGVRYFIQIHFRVIFLVSSVSVFGKSSYSGSGQLLAAENREREGNPEPTRGDPERNKGGHLGFCVKVRDMRGEGSVDSFREGLDMASFPPGNPVAGGPLKAAYLGTQIIFQEQVKSMYSTVPPAKRQLAADSRQLPCLRK